MTRLFRPVVLGLTLGLAISAISTRARADAYDAAMAHAAVAKEKALEGGSPVDWADALERFIAADALRPTREVKYEIAFAASKVKADDVAVEAYEGAIALGLEGPARLKADEFLTENAGKMARVEVRAPRGAQVFVGTRRRAVTPLARPIVIFAGTTALRIVSGGRAVERDVTATAGETKVVDVNDALAPPPAVAPPKPLPPPPSPSPPEAPRSHVLDYGLIVGGGTLAVAGVVTWVIATQTVSARRGSLAEVCREYRTDDPDLCARADDDETRGWAQEDSNAIHTFKPLRVVGVVAAGVGLVASGIGAFRLSSGATMTPGVSSGTSGTTFTLRVVF